MPSSYANLFGVPGQGVHSWRFLGIAVVDVLATIILSLLTSIIFNTPFLLTFIIWVIIGEILHYLFGTQTAVMNLLHINAQCHNDKK